MIFDRTSAHPPEKVWRALTESEHMRWWMPVDMIGERRAGATVDPGLLDGGVGTAIAAADAAPLQAKYREQLAPKRHRS